MTRWIMLAILIVVLTALATVAVQLLPASALPSDDPAYPAVPPESKGPLPLAVVDGSMTYNFGRMAQKVKGSKSWTIRNDGPGELTLQAKPACSCTVGSLDGVPGKQATTVKPGAETEIKIEWDTKETTGKYSKSLPVETNDPRHPSLDFFFEGEVQPALISIPAGNALTFLNASNEQNQTTRMMIVSPDQPDFKILEVMSSRPAFMETKLEPLTDEDRKALGTTLPGGYKLMLTLKPGMPLGPFKDEMVVRTDHPSQPELHVAVSGTMIGPISVMPHRILMSPSEKYEEVTLWVRGGRKVNFTVAEKPEKLDVSIVASDKVVDGATEYRLRVAVPPGTASGKVDGEIVLKTDHPMASEVKIPVQAIIVGEAS